MSEEVKKMRTILVLKRSISMEDDMFDLPSIGDEEGLIVKAMTYPILLPQGIYVLAGWDMTARRPGILVLNHTLFPALRRWVRDYMQPIEDNVFEITPSKIGGVIEYNMSSMGKMRILDKEEAKIMNSYLDDLLGEIDVEVTA